MSLSNESETQVDSEYLIACFERERSIQEDALPYQFDYSQGNPNETEAFRKFCDAPIRTRMAMLKKAIIRVDNLSTPAADLEEQALDSVNDEIKDLYLQEEQLEVRFWRLYAIVAFMQDSYDR